MGKRKKMTAVLLLAVILCTAADMMLFFAIRKGWFDAGPKAGRGSYAEAKAEEEYLEEQAKEFVLEGSAWKGSEGNYCFTEEGGYYFISEKTENYIRGSALITELKAEDIPGSKGDIVLGAVEDAHYFRVDIVVDTELYFGSRRSGNTYTLYVAANTDEAYIYDSGWGEASGAKSMDFPLLASLEDYFDIEELYAEDIWGPADDPSVFSRMDVDFNIVDNYKEAWHMVQIGDCVVMKLGDEQGTAFYLTTADAQEQPQFLYRPENGQELTIMGTDGKDLIFGLGTISQDGYTTQSLYRMDLLERKPELLVNDKVQDFCIYEGTIYYTDYTRLMRLNSDGSISMLWNYGVYSYEIANGLVFLYDGDAWELIDTETGEDYGYICDGNNYAYECDLTKYTEDYLYYVAYDYTRESISLRALNIWTGDERIVGGEYAGNKNDTYNVVFCNTCCYFTAGNGEELICVDVSSGEANSRRLEEAGWWYATEMFLIDGVPVLYAFDQEEKAVCLNVGEQLEMTEIAAFDPEVMR